MSIVPCHRSGEESGWWRYPLLAVVLSGVLVLEVAVAHVAAGGPPLSVSAVCREISLRPATYSYIGAGTIAILASAGSWLGRKEDHLRKAASTDPVTGLYNRGHFDERLEQQLACVRRCGGSVALLFIDIDRLKQVNDRLGHGAGDAALRLVADAIRQTCRSRDLAARWGGDEFALLALNASAIEGAALAQRIRTTLARLAGERGWSDASPTVSIGIGDLTVAEGKSPDALLAAADRALYAAKRGGRDRAEVASRTIHGGWAMVGAPRRREETRAERV